MQWMNYSNYDSSKQGRAAESSLSIYLDVYGSAQLTLLIDRCSHRWLSNIETYRSV